jgi:hypothetical protein
MASVRSLVADASICLEAADKLVTAAQFKTAVNSYFNCSKNTDGLAAGCTLFKAYSVLHERLGDVPAALAAWQRARCR